MSLSRIKGTVSIILSVVLLFALFGYADTSTHPQNLQITNFSVFSNWLPVIFLAILMSFLITIIYYVIGFLLNNKNIKSKATAEFAQVIGTAIVVLVILFVFNLIGTTLISPVSILNPQTANNFCLSLSASSVYFLNSFHVHSPTRIICSDIIAPLVSPNPQSNMTIMLDYGLSASYLVIANVTNQVATNLNAFYVYDSIVSFLSHFQSLNTLQIGTTNAITLNYTPLSGYSFLTKMISGIAIVSNLSLYSFIIQLLVILMAITAWPYVLGAGIVLRSTFYTRRIGGLLIGVVLALLIILPMIFLFEYSALSSNQNSFPIGVNSTPYLPIYEELPNGTVEVYGDVSGYANVAGYCNGGMVYETQCGNASTITSPPICANPSTLSAWQKCDNGYVASVSGCPKGYYGYETVCGDPHTLERQTTVGLGYAKLTQPLCIPPSKLPPDANICPKNAVPRGSSVYLFNLPNATDMLRYYTCWPPSGSVAVFETWFAGLYLIPFYGLAEGIAGAIGYVGGSLVTAAPVASLYLLGCIPNDAINAGLSFANIYGLTALTAFLLPLMNVLIVYSAAMGFSGLLGGDTDILGLSKFV